MVANASSPTSERLALAKALADRAGAMARQYWRTQLNVDHKADASPVTDVDREIERAWRNMLATRTPDAGIYGEEFGADGQAHQDLWVLDPIDGTGAFITGSPLFGSLIGFLIEGTPQIGVIEMPALHERWTAARGLGAHFNGTPCLASGLEVLRNAALATTSPFSFSDAERTRFAELARRVSITRFGGDCYAYALLAAGHVDLVVECALMPYDYLPIVPIVEEAGGVMTDWDGTALTISSDGRVIAAASEALHAAALEVLNG